MPLGNPTPLRQEMHLTSLARSTPDFRIKVFLKQYFLSQYELAARGYDKLRYRGVIEEGFDGFISKNECSINGGSVIAVCMINPKNRVSFAEYINKKEFYGVHFWCLRSYKQMGGAPLNPDCLMMEVSGFPKISLDKERLSPGHQHLSYELNEIGSRLFAKKKTACYPIMISRGFELIEQRGLKTSKKE